MRQTLIILVVLFLTGCQKRKTIFTDEQIRLLMVVYENGYRYGQGNFLDDKTIWKADSLRILDIANPR